MKIKDVIVEQGFLRSVGRELGRRVTMLPDQRRELDRMEELLLKLTKQPLAQIQKQSKQILAQYKQELDKTDDQALALATAISPYYPDTAAQIIAAYSDEKKEKNKAQPSAAGSAQQPSAAVQTKQPAQQTRQSVVPREQGFVTTVIAPTAGGDRKFWYDGKNWKEYFGSNWPNDLQTSQSVTDDRVIDYIAKQVALKNTSRVPYGTTKQTKRKS